jgi:hypothetical protein
MFNTCYCNEPDMQDKIANSLIRTCDVCMYNGFKEIDKQDNKPFIGNKYMKVTLELPEDAVMAFIKKCNKDRAAGENIINQLMMSYCMDTLPVCIKNNMDRAKRKKE